MQTLYYVHMPSPLRRAFHLSLLHIIILPSIYITGAILVPRTSRLPLARNNPSNPGNENEANSNSVDDSVLAIISLYLHEIYLYVKLSDNVFPIGLQKLLLARWSRVPPSSVARCSTSRWGSIERRPIAWAKRLIQTLSWRRTRPLLS